MNWYVVHLLFAQQDKAGSSSFRCESCHVLFHAPSALVAYDKGVAWAGSHIEGTSFQFVGVEHIRDLDEEQPTDGTEINGEFFEEENIWQRKDEFIPEKMQIPAIVWERDSDTPIIEMMSEEKVQNLKQFFGTDSPG